MRRGLLLLSIIVGMGASSMVADAQPIPKKRPPTPISVPTASGPTNLRAHVGTDHAARLIRGDADDRIRGIERAAAIGTPEAVALLVESLERSDRATQIKSDTRALLAMARGLARFADQERARSGLLTIVGTGNPGLAGRLPSTSRSTSSDGGLEEGDPIARAELARQVAAIALAKSGGDRALEALYGVARGGGSGQSAAIVALSMYPPRDPGFFGTTGASMPVAVIRLLGQLGDLRALDVLHGAARSSDVAARCAALISLAELGDERAGPLARAAIAESDVRLRAASGEVFILLSAPERFKATAAIVADEATTAIGIHMAERVHNAEITKLVAARAAEHPDREIRTAAIRALGRSPDAGAAKALVMPQLLGDRDLAYYAISALARSPAPNAGALIGGLFPTRLASLAVRAYVVRAIVRGERASSSDDAIAKMVSSSKPAERALAIFARVALGDADADSFLDDKDARVRRAAVMGSMARIPKSIGEKHENETAILKRLAKELAAASNKDVEGDTITRQTLAFGLIGGDPEGLVKTSVLVDRAESGGADAALSAFALARRADESTARKVGQLLGAKDPVLRTHAARGLGVSNLPDGTGRLADAYAYETDVEVRRAIINALAARIQDANAPARKTTLALAAELDPDGPVRQAARRALGGTTTPFAPSAVREAAWLKITLDGGEAPGEAYVGSVVRSDGLAVPIVFDEEGYAVVPGLPPGEARLVLAPRLPSEAARDKQQPKK
jgi:cellulose synthase operon protein C